MGGLLSTSTSAVQPVQNLLTAPLTSTSTTNTDTLTAPTNIVTAPVANTYTAPPTQNLLQTAPSSISAPTTNQYTAPATNNAITTAPSTIGTVAPSYQAPLPPAALQTGPSVIGPVDPSYSQPLPPSAMQLPPSAIGTVNPSYSGGLPPGALSLPPSAIQPISAATLGNSALPPWLQAQNPNYNPPTYSGPMPSGALTLPPSAVGTVSGLVNQPSSNAPNQIAPTSVNYNVLNQPLSTAAQQGTNGQSVEQSALNGGGVDNKQQISNFMTALNNVGAGSNNTFMNSPSQPAPQVNDLIDPNIAYNNNPLPSQGYGGEGVLQGSGGVTPIAPLNELLNAQSANYQGAGALVNSPPPPQNYSTGAQGLPIGGNPITNYTNPFGQTASSVVNGGTSSPTPPPPPNTNLFNMPLVSDERLKTNIAPATNDLTHFMQTINAHNYSYKNPERDGQGTFTSPMAQELEATKLGKQAVINTPQGKMVDYARLGGVNLAAVSVVYQEQEKLKKQIQQMKAQLNKKRG